MNSGSRTDAGWRTGRPRPIASILTGPGAGGEEPLRRGRSGWVTTAAISSPESSRAFNDGTANSGVPMKTKRMAPSGRNEVPVSGSLSLLHLLLDQPPLERAQVLDEETPVQMVDLVVERPGQQSRSFERADLAAQIHRLDHRALRPPHPFRESGKAEASLVLEIGTRVLDDPGVDQHQDLGGVFAAGKVDDRDPPRHAHL